MRLPSGLLAVRALGAGEVVLGLAAGITFSPPLLALTAAAYLAFAVFVVAALGSNVPLQSCGCFGQADTPPSAAHVVLDLAAAITVIAALVTDTPGSRATLADQPWHAAPFLLLLAICVYLCVLVLTVLPLTLVRRTSA